MEPSLPLSTRNVAKKRDSFLPVTPGKKKKNGITTVSLHDLPPLTTKQIARLKALKETPIDVEEEGEFDLENAVAMPPMTQFKSAKEYNAYYQKQLKAQQKQKKQVTLEVEPDVYRWYQSRGKDAPKIVSALLKDYIALLERHAQ